MQTTNRPSPSQAWILLPDGAEYESPNPPTKDIFEVLSAVAGLDPGQARLRSIALERQPFPGFPASREPVFRLEPRDPEGYPPRSEVWPLPDDKSPEAERQRIEIRNRARAEEVARLEAGARAADARADALERRAQGADFLMKVARQSQGASGEPGNKGARMAEVAETLNALGLRRRAAAQRRIADQYRRQIQQLQNASGEPAR